VIQNVPDHIYYAGKAYSLTRKREIELPEGWWDVVDHQQDERGLGLIVRLGSGLTCGCGELWSNDEMVAMRGGCPVCGQKIDSHDALIRLDDLDSYREGQMDDLMERRDHILDHVLTEDEVKAFFEFQKALDDRVVDWDMVLEVVARDALRREDERPQFSKPQFCTRCHGSLYPGDVGVCQDCCERGG
jgi:hypothetical protein